MTSAKTTRGRKRTLFCFSRAGVGPSSPAFPAPRSPIPAEPGACSLRDMAATPGHKGNADRQRGSSARPPGHSGGEHRALPELPFCSSPSAGSKPSPPATLRGGGVPPPASCTTQPRRRPPVTLPSPLYGTRQPQQARWLGHPPSFPFLSLPPSSQPSLAHAHPPGDRWET